MSLPVSLLSLGVAVPVIDTIATGALFVAVTDPSGKPLPGADLVLTVDDVVVAKTVTDSEGEGRFLNLAPNDYAIRARHAGFVPASEPVTLEPDARKALKIVLQPE